MEYLRKYGEYAALAGLSCLAAALVRLALGGEFNVFVQGLVIVGVLLLLAYAMGRPQEVVGALTGRRARYGSNAVIMTVAFLGIVVLVNYLGTRYEKRLDWTQDSKFTISEQTKKVLANLDAPVKVTGFFQQGDSRQEQVSDLFKEYKQYTGLLAWDFIDPDVQPSAARQAGITDYATLVFESKGRKQSITGLDESALTSAIVRVSSGDQKVIYFLTGHGERGMDATGQDGYSVAKQALEKDNYVIKAAALAVTPTVPADCALLIVAGPTKPLLDGEITAINNYLDKGGKLLFLTDPQVTTGLEGGVLKRLGIQVRNDIVVDPASSLLGDVASPMVNNYGWSPITKDLRASAIFPLARSLAADQKLPEGVTLVQFAQTGPDSWGETDLTSTQVSFDPAKDVKGPLTLGLSVEVAHSAGGITTAPTARLVVYGDSDFASNALASALANLDLFANSVNWLAQDESLISIRAKPPTNRMLSMTSSEQILALISSLVFLPLAVLLAGAVVWWRRR
jgi:ABC-type uncharacterized transport system involved in gliding motility auxiliary subunit